MKNISFLKTSIFSLLIFTISTYTYAQEWNTVSTMPPEIAQYAESLDCKFDEDPEGKVGNLYLYNIFDNEPNSAAISCVIGSRNHLLIKSKKTSCSKIIKLYSNTIGFLSRVKGNYTLEEHIKSDKKSKINMLVNLIQVSYGEELLEVGFYCHNNKWYSLQLSGEIF